MTPRRRTEVLDGQRDAVTLCRCYTVILEFTPYPHQLAEKGKVTVKSRAVLGRYAEPEDRRPLARWGRYIRYRVRGSSITVRRFQRLRGRGLHIRRTCVYVAGGAYTHPLCIRTYRSRKRTHPRIRTLGCVYARTCVYAPTAAYKHICVNAASWAYTHLFAYTHPTLRIRRDATNVMHARRSQTATAHRPRPTRPHMNKT